MKQLTRMTLSALVALCLACGGTAAFAAGQETAEPAGAASPVIERVSINSADADTLAAKLHRVGEKKAQAIIEWREANGQFTSREQLLEVKGIGEKTLSDNMDNITL